ARVSGASRANHAADLARGPIEPDRLWAVKLGSLQPLEITRNCRSRGRLAVSASDPGRLAVRADAHAAELPAQQPAPLDGEREYVAQALDAGHQVEDEVAQAIDDRLAAIDFVGLYDVGMRAHHQIGAGVDRQARHGLLVRRLGKLVFDSPVR